MMEEITKIVADYYNVKYSDVFLKERTQHLVRVRQMAMYLGRVMLRLTHQEIGKFFNKDHATSIHAIKTVSNEVKFSNKKRYEEREIKTRIYERRYSSIHVNLNLFCIPTAYTVQRNEVNK